MKEVGILFGSVQSILTDNLNIQHVSLKFVSRILTHEYKENCLQVACDVPEYTTADSEFMKKYHTGDETL